MTLFFRHQGEHINKMRITHESTSTACLEKIPAKHLILAEAVESYPASRLHR
jgi:hypothetical protein